MRGKEGRKNSEPEEETDSKYRTKKGTVAIEEGDGA